MAATPTPTPKKSPPTWLVLIAAIIFLAPATIWWVTAPTKSGTSRISHNTPFKLAPEKTVFATYVGSVSCKECHEEAYNLWAKSSHGLAERLPEAKRDAVAFDPARTLKHGTQQTSFRQREGHYEIITAGPHGTNELFPVQRILANVPLRQALIAIPGGRLQATEAAWDPKANEWFNVYGNEDRKPGEWGHWTGRGMNWNSMCAACHNTRTRKNYDTSTDTYHTTMVEMSVTCEACHGPLKAHVDWQKQNRNQNRKDPTTSKRTPNQLMDACASCHARRAELTGDFKPGDAFLDHYDLTIVDQSDTFYPDGQIRDEDYEFTAFMGSRMHQAGVTCLDCHPRALHLPRLQGNDMCQRCHAGGLQKAPIIKPEEHSHHSAGSKGNECVACHMPITVYMQRHPRHDHGLTIPDPLLTKQFGIPNACERCHTDKGTDWNLKSVEQWYGTNMNRPYRQRAQTVARARQGDDGAVAPLLNMLNRDNNFYWRAVAANLLQRWSDEPRVTTALLGELNHTNALVRQMAVRALGPLTREVRPEVTEAIQPKLKDISRNVRIEAAQHLVATLDTNSLAGSEYLHFLDQIADQPLGQMQRGVFELQRGDPTNALPHYQTAAKWDPYSPGIRHELAMVLSQMGRASDAVKELQAAVKLAPNDAEFHYKLALAYNELSESGKVLPELEEAVKLDPHHARAGYNLGLARNAAGNPTGAIQALLAAETADPRDPRIPYARATIHAQLGQISEARTAAQRALELNPRFTGAASLLQQLQ